MGGGGGGGSEEEVEGNRETERLRERGSDAGMQGSTEKGSR